eukprot:IDg12506t1
MIVMLTEMDSSPSHSFEFMLAKDSTISFMNASGSLSSASQRSYSIKASDARSSLSFSRSRFTLHAPLSSVPYPGRVASSESTSSVDGEDEIGIAAGCGCDGARPTSMDGEYAIVIAAISPNF